MASVKSADTSPELAVRKLLFSIGFRYRLHQRGLPGKPDIVLPKYKTAIFVHGCFWHGHSKCRRARRPASNREFWEAKLDRNIERDRRVERELQILGWKVVTIWECETKNINRIVKRLGRIMLTPDLNHYKTSCERNHPAHKGSSKKAQSKGRAASSN